MSMRLCKAYIPDEILCRVDGLSRGSVPAAHIIRQALARGLDQIETEIAAGDRSVFAGATHSRESKALARFNSDLAAQGRPPVPDWIRIRREGGEPAVQAELARQRAYLASHEDAHA